LIFYCSSYRLNTFRALLCPSSGARDYDVDYHIGFVVLGVLYVGGKVLLGWSGVGAAGSSNSVLQPAATTPLQPNSTLTSNIQHTKNDKTNVVINIIVASS